MKMGPGYRGPRIAAHEKRLEQFRQTLENLAQKIVNKEGVFANSAANLLTLKIVQSKKP